MKLTWLLSLFISSLCFAAGKDFIPPNLIVTNCAMTGTSVCTSTVVDIRGFDNIALQANYTGTPTGTFAVEASEDYNPNTHNAGHWTALSASLTAPSGSAGTSYVEVNPTAAAYLRVTYTNATGTGVLNVYLGAKAL